MVRGAKRHDMVRDAMEAYGIPSTSFRYKIWWMWTHVTQQICTNLGVHFVAGPAETRDASGFLDRRYYADGVHGTDEYGMLMAHEVGRAMAALGVVEP